MPNPMNRDQVKAILSKNGVNDLDQLADLIASSSLDNPGALDINPVASSWVIKVWKLSASASIAELPDDLGGDILRGTGASGNIGN